MFGTAELPSRSLAPQLHIVAAKVKIGVTAGPYLYMEDDKKDGVKCDMNTGLKSQQAMIYQGWYDSLVGANAFLV